ncbi:MAG: hypothetical protein ABEK59_05230 [Halobacteria archaeon]
MFGDTYSQFGDKSLFMGFFNRNGTEKDQNFVPKERYEPEYLPEPSDVLEGYQVLTGEEHTGLHSVIRGIFEERKVYDMTFNYNLARLNLDTRHPRAGLRYAEKDENTVLIEFTPTTEFCPQAETLAKAVFVSTNDLSEKHGYELVEVRVRNHEKSVAINRLLTEKLDRYRKEGSIKELETLD